MTITNEQLNELEMGCKKVCAAMNIDPDLALAVFAAARRGIAYDAGNELRVGELTSQLERLKLENEAYRQENTRMETQLSAYRAKEYRNMSEEEKREWLKKQADYEGMITVGGSPTAQETVNVATCWEVPDAAEPSTAGLLEKINELRMTTARNDTHQENHRRWLYECRDLLFSPELRAALKLAAMRMDKWPALNALTVCETKRDEWKAKAEAAEEDLMQCRKTATDRRIQIEQKDAAMTALAQEANRLEDTIAEHENEIATQRDEIRGLHGLVAELGKDLLERQRMQSEQATECERLLTGIILIWRIYLKRTTHLGLERKSGLQKECIACICALLTGQSVDGKATIEELHEALAAKPAPEPKL